VKNNKQQPEIVVLKFGSSVLRSEKDLPRAVHEIYRRWRGGAQVLAVVSAFGNATDELLKRAESISDQPEASALAALVATGEATASAMLCLATGKAGMAARVLDPAQAGLRTVGERLEAELVAVDVARLKGELRRAVVVLPGFVGRGEGGYTTLLGRGGSDFSAFFIANQLGARCVLLKDVDGLYTSDPACSSKRPTRFAQIRYETALRVGSQVVQPKALRFAASRGLGFEVTAVGAGTRTVVGGAHDRVETSSESQPLRVALLGCGTVGGGVYQRLAALPELFTVTGVGTRSGARARAAEVPERLITSDLENLIEGQCDVVIELMGGPKYAAGLTTKALRSGRHVITANKALMAGEGERLLSLAAVCGVRLRYSAAVGGALPALEAIERARNHGAIRSFSGVLNATSNFVLDSLAEGKDLQSAVAAAQKAGYAEANARLDLDGTDATQKLILLARQAFGISLPFDVVTREGVDQIDPLCVRKSCEQGQKMRLVASCRLGAEGLEASVKLLELPQWHPLSSAAGLENRLLIESIDGRSYVVSGTGAGRWPTTEAVMADLLDIRRETQPADVIAGFKEREEYVA